MKRDAGGAVGGTGIGLAVVRRLVTQHGGQVRVEGAEGEGARFIVTLPRG
jgi:signal transduction histidine kinase